MTQARRLLATYGRRALEHTAERERPWLRLQLERARIVYGAVLEARARKSRPGYPLPLAELERSLRALDLEPGDLVYVQSSLEHLYRASAVRTAEASLGRLRYAAAVVDLLFEIVGPTGTIVMNTDGVTHRDVFRAWADQVPRDEAIFDYRTTPSRRGLVSELFRRRADAIRSVHPWYNMTAAGPLAETLVGEDVRSTPYAMDEHSATYKLTMRGGRIVLLGSGFDLNVPLHLVEYALPDEFPRPVYANRPTSMTYVDRDGSVQSIEVLLHTPQFYVEIGVSARNFCTYLDRKYELYRRLAFQDDVELVSVDARRQYEALVAEMKENVTVYDPAFAGRQG